MMNSWVDGEVFGPRSRYAVFSRYPYIRGGCFTLSDQEVKMVAVIIYLNLAILKELNTGSNPSGVVIRWSNTSVFTIMHHFCLGSSTVSTLLSFKQESLSWMWNNVGVVDLYAFPVTLYQNCRTNFEHLVIIHKWVITESNMRPIMLLGLELRLWKSGSFLNSPVAGFHRWNKKKEGYFRCRVISPT